MASKSLTPAGLRGDGRRPGELRHLRVKMGHAGFDGSAYIEMGQTRVLAQCHGPHEVSRRQDELHTQVRRVSTPPPRPPPPPHSPLSLPLPPLSQSPPSPSPLAFCTTIGSTPCCKLASPRLASPRRTTCPPAHPPSPTALRPPEGADQRGVLPGTVRGDGPEAQANRRPAGDGARAGR